MTAGRAARAAAVMALTSALATANAPAVQADDTNIRVVYAVFTGSGSVSPVDGGAALGVDVSADIGQCTAVVVIGTSVPTPVGCGFNLKGSITRSSGTPCAGEGFVPGTLTLYPPSFAYPHEFSYTMRVAAAEGSANGFGSGGGTSYAQFSFTATRCGAAAPNQGLAEY